MIGLFTENGPLRVKRNGTGTDDFQLYSADASWADSYHLVFLDQPVGTGFSYGNSYTHDVINGSNEFEKFLSLFYQEYPELAKNKLILTGESFAGKYLPLYTT